MSHKWGRGTLGVTFQRKEEVSERKTVVKKVNIKCIEEETRKKLLREMERCKNTENQHENLLIILDFVIEKNKLIVTVEDVGSNHLGVVIEEHKRKMKYLKETVIIDYLHQVLSGLSYLHYRLDMLHGNLKPSNVLITNDGKLKLSDTGMGMIFTDERAPNKGIMTTPYCLAPELMNERKYSEKSDVWSLGIVAFELAELEMPATAFLPGFRRCEFALEAQSRGRLLMCSRNSALLRRFVESMLDKNPRTRPSSQQLFDHDILRPFRDDAEERGAAAAAAVAS